MLPWRYLVLFSFVPFVLTGAMSALFRIGCKSPEWRSCTIVTYDLSRQPTLSLSRTQENYKSVAANASDHINRQVG